jgi:hypothetical protein
MQTSKLADGPCKGYVSRDTVDYWFRQCLEPVPTNLGLSLVEKPMKIYNLDEARLSLSRTPKTTLTRCGQKSPQALLPGSGGEKITVQMSISASGQFLLPYVIYKGERLMSDATYGGPLGSSVSLNGCMIEQIFLD